jgi:hypothetical protein
MALRAPRANKLPREVDHPTLKEFTIAVGDHDLYVNLDRFVEVDADHVLYEAVLTDEEGSHVIYVERDELEACLKDSPILKHPPTNPEPRRPSASH